MTCCNLHELWEIFILLISFITVAANQLAPFGVASNLCGLLSFYQIIIVQFFIRLLKEDALCGSTMLSCCISRVKAM